MGSSKRKCSAKDCKSDESRPEDLGVSFHKLPVNPIIKEKWRKLCKIIEEDKRVLYVCSRHFLKADFGNYKAKFVLKPKALPSIFPWSIKTALKKDSNTEGNISNQNKRIRKKKLSPDFVSDFKNSAYDQSSSVRSSSEDFLESEDSTSTDLPPVLEAEMPIVAQNEQFMDEIPELKVATVKMHNKKRKLGKLLSQKQKKKKKALFSVNSLIKKKSRLIKTTKHKSTESKPMEPLTSQSIIKSKIIVKDKCTPDENNTFSNSSSPSAFSPNPERTTNSLKIGNQSTKVAPSHKLTTFEPNTRIEALDINQKWCSAMILEVDYEENEVLVHFDTYSNKYDEWISINSSSIRAPSNRQDVENDGKEAVDSSGKVEEETYQVGERCMALWENSKRFPATVAEVLDGETYVVKFDDGFVETVKAGQMTKSIFMPIKSSKEARRNKKRKLNVQSLFNKKRTKTASSLDSTMGTDDCSSADETLMKTGGFDKDAWYPEFENGVPVGVPSYLKSKLGLRETTVVPDPNLPENWEKHVVPRERGKYYSIIVTSDDKKLRCPADISRYIQDHPDFKYQDYRLDFSLVPKHTKQKPQLPPERKSIDAMERAREAVNTPPPVKPDALKIVQVDGVFTCPIEGCKKIFRRENLVQMHVKHYHPEYTKFLESTPNVLDLVYQRLHGEEFESASPSRTQEYPKRGSFTPDELITGESDLHQKDTEIKRLLGGSGHVDGFEANSSPLESKPRDMQGIDMGLGPDLKSLVVTTKSGLKTIPAVKKEPREEVSDPKDSKKRKANELDDCPDVAPDGMDLPETEMKTIPGQSLLDHIIGEDGKVIKIEHMRKEEIIHCTCGITEEDGLMIQCEICMCWQHAHCNNIYRETEVPEKYVCFTCLNPQGQRASMKYRHDQDWLKYGRLPTGGYHCRDEEANLKRFEQLKTSHDISGGLLELKDYMHTLKQKIKIAEMKNHPKLYLWSKPWRKDTLPENTIKQEEIKEEIIEESIDCNDLQSNAPQPEAAIETDDCRLNLLEHILHCQTLIEERLVEFEKEIDNLDAGDSVQNEEDDNRMRLAASMLYRDLGKLKEFSHFV